MVAIGQGTAAEAARVCASLGVAYPCLGDPGKDSYRAFGLPRAGWKEILWDPIWQGSSEASRQGHKVSLRDSLLQSSDWFQLPGLAIVDRGGVVRFLHRARHSADLPATADVLRALDAVAGAS